MPRKRKNQKNILEKNRKYHLKMNQVKAAVAVTAELLPVEQAAAEQLVMADRQLQVTAGQQVPRDRLMVALADPLVPAVLVGTVAMPMLRQ
jgi:hypothetical protein